MTRDSRRALDVAMVFEGGVALLALLLAWLLRIDLGASSEVTWRALALGTALTVPPLVAMWAVSEIRWAPFQRLRQEVDAVIGALFANASLLDLAMISLLAGVGEEALFRGVLQPLIQSWTTPLVGLAAASALFGLMHLVTPTYAILAAAVGLYLGGLFLYTGNLAVPIVVHAMYDFVALMYLRQERAGAGRSGQEEEQP